MTPPDADSRLLFRSGEVRASRRPLGLPLAGIILALAIAGCSATDRTVPPQPSAISPASTEVSTAAQSSGLASESPTPQSLNPLESKIVKALATLGISASPAELNLESASIGAQFAGGAELYINGHATSSNGGSATTRSERLIEGVTVRSLAYPGVTELVDEFDCGGTTYDARGSTPPGFGGFDAFLGRLIVTLECA